jgi:glycosyltransferase 2 family protein
MKPWMRFLFLLLGVSICAVLLWHADWALIRGHLAKLGWMTPLVFIPYGLVYLADSLGWKLAFGREGTGKAGYPTMVRIRWSGESLNNLVPSAYVGGEALKVFLLRRQEVPMGRATAAAIVSKTIQTLAQLIYLASAAFAFSSLLPTSSPVRKGLWMVMVGSLVVVGLMFWAQSRGLVRSLTAVASKLRLAQKIIREKQERIRQIDQSILRFYRDEPRYFAMSFCAYLSGWFLDTLEIWLAAYLLGMPVSWLQALAVEAFVAVAKILGLFIPAALGVQETGIILLGRAAGFPEPFCFAYAVLRRTREILFALVGWSLLALQGISLKSLKGSNPLT